MIETNYFLNHPGNKFNSAPKLGFLTWESMGIDSFLEPASSGHPVNCSFLHFRIGLIAQPRMLPLGGEAISMVCRRKANVVCIILLIRERFLSVFFTSSTMTSLKCSRLEGSSPWGKLGRKLTSARLGLLMFECEGSLSGFLRLLFPAFTVTSSLDSRPFSSWSCNCPF